MTSFVILSRPFLSLLLITALPSGATAADPQPKGEVLVAAASDLRFALDDLIIQFTNRYPECQPKPIYGSSGNFHAQIVNNAPFDLYLSADAAYPRAIISAGKASEKDFFLYAIGRLVVWAPKNSKIDVPALGIKSLLDPAVKKIAIANPEHAPYGRAAIAALKHFKIYDQVSKSLVLGENIAQAAQFIESANVDIGIIALSLAISPKMKPNGQFWEIPLEAFPRLEQGGLVLPSARNAAAARVLRDFMLDPHGRELLQKYGFLLPH
jgi:molybdate transport system substrate-binding protein